MMMMKSNFYFPLKKSLVCLQYYRLLFSCRLLSFLQSVSSLIFLNDDTPCVDLLFDKYLLTSKLIFLKCYIIFFSFKITANIR